MAKLDVNRRGFLKGSAAGAAALTLSAVSYGKVLGANDKIGVGFVGVGGRCQAHLDIINKLRDEKQGVEPVAVCDIYKHNLEVAREKTGAKAYRDEYQELLDDGKVDVVCIATPDHWHAKISIDAAAKGKHVYCEKPMTKTIKEAHDVVDAMQKHKRVMTVGVQSMADPRWRMANELIRKGEIGHVAQGQTSYYRNSDVGQWRYYELRADMTPKTINWKKFLGLEYGLAPEMPFDRAVFAQWRCYWPFGGGMFTDLFVHQTTHLIAAMGVRYPARVVGAGGIYLEYDGRDVPDVATVVADYDEGCQMSITATMIASYPVEEVIRGHLATIKFMEDGYTVIKDPPKGKAGIPARLEESVKGNYVDCHPPKAPKVPPKGHHRWPHADTELLWLNFLKCVRNQNRHTWSPPELGAAAFTTVNMGVQSYRQGRVLFWDKKERKAVTADASWAKKWEERSHKRGKPNQIQGWEGDEKGSLLHPPEYMKLAGPWEDGKDPAGK
jgi:predicted dehydrogenase